MKLKLVALITFCITTVTLTAQKNTKSDLIGKWLRMSQNGPVALEFKKDGIVEVDFNNDQSVDVVSNYKIDKNTVEFSDKEGAMCLDPGVYKFEITDYYLSFDYIEDMCNGRTKMTMGFWAKPNFEELLDELSQKISETQNTTLNLSRARIYLALGKSAEARKDLDVYLEKNQDDARALINRAGTRFPGDMKGVVKDCNKAIALEPENKNAFFLRGLALYELGQKEKACDDFSRAIELGFSILKVAEEYRCSEYWEKTNN
ncbi:tetratricopeptide repeat protein [Maribellus mangrovi]|uniref:tetratricopeptide repeat protein n=1 Tax=Maribellus mangrovi TaxID=3133146 RepID=UPI0030ECDBDB